MNTCFQFNNSLYKKLYFGENCYSQAINEIISQHHLKNIFLISTKSLDDTKHYNVIKENIKKYLVAEFPKARAHTPQSIVNEAVNMLKSVPKIDAIISFGGGSVVDLAKAIAYEINSTNPTAIISLPTTLSGAEFTSGFAMTDEEGVKHLVNTSQLAPAWIILDPILTLNTPNSLWASTGCKTFSDCVEAICSKNANPYTDQLAYSAIQLLNTHLLSSYHDSNDLFARQRVLLAPAFALPAGINTFLGLVAAFRHQLGARFNMSHGIASAIMMPHVLRWNFDFSIDQYAALAQLLNLANNSDSTEVQANQFLDHTNLLIRNLHLNERLSNYIENKTMLEKVIVPIMESPCTKANPRTVTCKKEIYDLLEAAW